MNVTAQPQLAHGPHRPVPGGCLRAYQPYSSGPMGRHDRSRLSPAELTSKCRQPQNSTSKRPKPPAKGPQLPVQTNCYWRSHGPRCWAGKTSLPTKISPIPPPQRSQNPVQYKLPVSQATLDQTHVRLPPRANGQPMKALVCHTELHRC